MVNSSNSDYIASIKQSVLTICAELGSNVAESVFERYGDHLCHQTGAPEILILNITILEKRTSSQILYQVLFFLSAPLPPAQILCFLMIFFLCHPLLQKLISLGGIFFSRKFFANAQFYWALQTVDKVCRICLIV
ncbi:MAG: hypothetical protein NC489_25385 [Ruminococcus flavefaciens]|nr:hypothetical protein [Ruminococcus flavefaciens]